MKYLVKSFYILNRNVRVIFGAFILAVLPSIVFSNEVLSANFLISLLNIIVNLVGIAYTLSLPYLIAQQPDTSVLLKEVLHNTKRIILPFIVIMILFMAGIFGLGILLVTFGFNEAFISNISQIFSNPLSPFMLFMRAIFSLGASLFVFTPSYFSTQRQDLFNSIIDSIQYSFKNISFVATIFLASFIMTNLVSIMSLIPGISIWEVVTQSVLATYFYSLLIIKEISSKLCFGV